MDTANFYGITRTNGTWTSKHSNSPLALVNLFDHRHMYCTKAEMVAIAQNMGINASGTRSALAWRIARAIYPTYENDLAAEIEALRNRNN